MHKPPGLVHITTRVHWQPTEHLLGSLYKSTYKLPVRNFHVLMQAGNSLADVSGHYHAG